MDITELSKYLNKSAGSEVIAASVLLRDTNNNTITLHNMTEQRGIESFKIVD